MSFSVSNIAGGNIISNLSGTNGVAATISSNTLFYSTNSGATWTVSQAVTGAEFQYIGISGSNAVAMGKDLSDLAVIYYSTNSGVNWSASTFTSPINVSSIRGSISGTNVICLIENFSGDVSIFYSSDGGNNWNISQYSSAPFTILNASNYTTPDISGSNAIICIANSTNNDIYVSSNGGVTFTKPIGLPSISSGTRVETVSISGSNALFAGYATGGLPVGGFIFKSIDGGANWGAPAQINITNVEFSRSDLNGSVALVGGINTLTNNGIIYSTNDITGTVWTPVTLSGDFSFFSSISGSGINGLAALEYNVSGDGILFFTTNSGVSWTQSTTLPNNPIINVSLSSINGIAGTSNGIYYTSTPLCYEKNTLILILENEEEVYKKVSELKVGDLVKTYKQGYKKINLLRSFSYKPLNKNNELNLLYKHKDNGVILTGGHSILVDELTEQEKVSNDKYGFSETIEDKVLLLACSSDKFEKIYDDQEYELYHFSLESDEPKAHYGVYINDGILSESCSEEALLKIL